MLTRREALIGAASMVAASGRFQAPLRGDLTPEMFGAKGDGITNDTDAFAAMAAVINSHGGGKIVLRRTTYIVGKQQQLSADPDYAFSPATILDFRACHQPLIVQGQGARLRAGDGLRYGTFNRRTGRPTIHKLPYYGLGELASPYRSMLRAAGCSGGIYISDLELDGNSGAMQIGGKFGDSGWQIAGSGIELIDNDCAEQLFRLHSHHHLLDGIVINGHGKRNSASTLKNVRCEYNGRQGCSIVGGHNYSFEDCQFNHTGKGAVSSAPGAGVDIEAEGEKAIRSLHFSRCEFSNNSGAGLVADSGDSENATFEDCAFIGTTSWSAWPAKPRFRFLRCSFTGPIAHAYGDTDPNRAAQFHSCLFRDDPARSPTGEIYGGENSTRPIADLPDNLNVRFASCQFILTHDSVLPWTTNRTIFADCRMSQRSRQLAYPRGTFIGVNVIDGRVVLDGHRNLGRLIVNGRSMPMTRGGSA